jgi:thiamine biosynthesis protein ThiS
MKLILNGEEREFAEALSVSGLLETLQSSAGRVAVMVNGEVVKRDLRDGRNLRDGDRVEIIQMVGGG